MRRPHAAEAGFTLVELIVVMVILGVVLAGIVNVLVSGSRAQSDTSNRALAQQNARMAIDRLEYEARCATNATILSSGAGVYLSLPAQCTHATGNVSWCVVGGALKRYAATSCTGTAATLVGSITSATPFSFTLGSNATLPQLNILLSVNGGGSSDSFTVSDSLALQNAAQSIGTPSSSSGPPGSSVTITGTLYKPSTALTVTVGSTAATITSGSSTNGAGQVNATFTIPFLANGSYPIVVSDGTNTLTSSTYYTVTGSFDGLKFTSTNITTGGVLTCGSPSQNVTCTVKPLGNTGHFTGTVTLANAAGTAIANGTSTLTVSAGTTTGHTPGASLSPTSSTIASGASGTASGFTLTGLGAGWISTMTCSVTINGTVYTIAVTGSAT